jgi:acetyl-CoA acetyltransferase
MPEQEAVYVAGVGMTRFGRHPLGSGAALVREAGLAALRDAGLTLADIDVIVMASCHPASPMGVTVAKELGVTGQPLLRIESQSASGLVGVHAAAESLRAGSGRRALVIGFDAPEYELAVEEVVAQRGELPPIVMFALWASRRMHERGTTAHDLALVAAKNWNYARSNPFAGRRADAPVTAEQVLASRLVAPPYTSMMCTSWGEGAAAAVLTLDRPDADERPVVRLSAAELSSETYQPGHIFLGAIVGPPAITAATSARAYEAAGLGPQDLDLVQVHDAFAVEELEYYELLGLCAEGEAEKWLREGAFGPGSRERFGLPEVSTDGGLIARGHPGGPTGLAQVHETVRRLRSGPDRTGLCHLLGAGSVCAVQIYEREGDIR